MFILSDPLKKINKLLKLDKPLVVFDLETTGLGISGAKIIELAYIKIWSDNRIKKERLMFNPEIPISAESTSIHGITSENVKDTPSFQEKAQEIWEEFNDCYYSGFNIMNFDLMILRREFARVGMDFDYKASQIIDSKTIYQYMVPRTLSAAYEYYCHKTVKQHSALSGAETVAEILIKQLEKYKEARDWEFIGRIHKVTREQYVDNDKKFFWRRGKAYFAFSKYRNRALDEIAEEDPEFLKWILSADFSEETKSIVKKAVKEKK